MIDGIVKYADSDKGFLALDDVTFTPECKLTEFELNIPNEIVNKPGSGSSGSNSGLVAGITIPLFLIILGLIGFGYYRYKKNGNLSDVFSLPKFGSNHNPSSFDKTTVDNTNPELSMSNPSFN